MVAGQVEDRIVVGQVQLHGAQVAGARQDGDGVDVAATGDFVDLRSDHTGGHQVEIAGVHSGNRLVKGHGVVDDGVAGGVRAGQRDRGHLRRGAVDLENRTDDASVVDFLADQEADQEVAGQIDDRIVVDQIQLQRAIAIAGGHGYGVNVVGAGDFADHRAGQSVGHQIEIVDVHAGDRLAEGHDEGHHFSVDRAFAVALDGNDHRRGSIDGIELALECFSRGGIVQQITGKVLDRVVVEQVQPQCTFAVAGGDGYGVNVVGAGDAADRLAGQSVGHQLEIVDVHAGDLFAESHGKGYRIGICRVVVAADDGNDLWRSDVLVEEVQVRDDLADVDRYRVILRPVLLPTALLHFSDDVLSRNHFIEYVRAVGSGRRQTFAGVKLLAVVGVQIDRPTLETVLADAVNPVAVEVVPLRTVDFAGLRQDGNSIVLHLAVGGGTGERKALLGAQAEAGERIAVHGDVGHTDRQGVQPYGGQDIAGDHFTGVQPVAVAVEVDPRAQIRLLAGFIRNRKGDVGVLSRSQGYAGEIDTVVIVAGGRRVGLG